MPRNDYEIFRDTILYAFRKRNTAFLTTEKILLDLRFQAAIFPKEDKERLDGILEMMREKELVLTNQPKFVALTSEGKEAVGALTDERISEVEKEMEERLK